MMQIIQPSEIGQDIVKAEYKNVIYEVIKSGVGYTLKINNMSTLKISKKTGEQLFDLFVKINE